MVEFFRGSEQSIIKLDISMALNYITVFKKSGSYAISEKNLKIPGDMFTIVNNGIFSATLSDRLIKGGINEIKIAIDRGRVRDTLKLEVFCNGITEEIPITDNYELITISAGSGEYVISGEKTADAEKEQELEETIGKLRTALESLLPDAVAKALEALSEERLVNDGSTSEFNEAYEELRSLRAENEGLAKNTESTKTEIKRVKELIHKATLYGREQSGELDKYRAELDDMVEKLGIDVSVLEYYAPADTGHIMEEVEQIRARIENTEEKLAQLIKNRERDISLKEKKAFMS